MLVGTLWPLLLLAVVSAQPGVPSPSATLSPTMTRTQTPASISNSASVSASQLSISVTPSVTNTPGSMSVSRTPSQTPYMSLLGRGCQRDACIAGSCSTGTRCCSGFCIMDQYVAQTISLGGSCNNAATAAGTACTLCAPGTTCSSGNICIVPGIGYDCPAICSTSADCVGGMACVSGKCWFGNRSVGASCLSSGVCAAGLTCQSNVCTAVGTFGSCNVANQPYDPTSSLTLTTYLDGGCINTAYCNSGACIGRLTNGVACSANAECQSNICNFGFCAAAQSVPSQGYCNTDRVCLSGLFCGGTVCQVKVGIGARCTQSFTLPYTTGASASNWCQAGLICSLFDNQRPQCMLGNLPQGATCYNSDQCSSASSFGCITSAPGVAGLCSGSSAGLPCLQGNSTWCGNGACSACTVTDGSAPGSYVCSTPAAAPSCATELAAAKTVVFADGFFSATPDPYAAHYAVTGSPVTAAYFCCLACTGISQGSVNYAAALLGRTLNCGGSPPGNGPAFSGATLTNVCAGISGTTGQTVPVTVPELLGSAFCPSATSSVSVSTPPGSLSPSKSFTPSPASFSPAPSASPSQASLTPTNTASQSFSFSSTASTSLSSSGSSGASLSASSSDTASASVGASPSASASLGASASTSASTSMSTSTAVSPSVGGSPTSSPQVATNPPASGTPSSDSSAIVSMSRGEFTAAVAIPAGAGGVLLAAIVGLACYIRAVRKLTRRDPEANTNAPSRGAPKPVDRPGQQYSAVERDDPSASPDTSLDCSSDDTAAVMQDVPATAE